MSTSPYRAPAGPRRRRPASDDGWRVLGVTGGIAAGKSTVVEALVACGATAVSADRAGHRVLEDEAVRAELRQAFGAGVLGADGAVDRRALGAVVFADAAALARLNAISHPRLLALLRRELDAVLERPSGGVAVLEAALLVEWDLGAWCDEVLAVVAPEAERVARAAAGHGLAPAEARARLGRQLPDDERVRYADRVLVNDGTVEELRARVRALYDAWAAGARRGRPSNDRE